MNKANQTQVATAAPTPPQDAAPHAEFDSGHGLLPLLAAAMGPIEPPPAQEAQLRARLLQRVARSASANQAFVTVRVQDGIWQAHPGGVRCRALHADEEAATCLLAWTGHDAVMPLPAGAHRHELLVLEGEAEVNGQTLRATDYLLLEADRDVSVHAQAGTRLYWRRIAAGPQAFGQSAPAARPVHADALAWAPLRPGVRIKPLHAEGERISMLVQVDAGASVPAHSHGHGEQCLMVEGDLFLGDVLLCQGDFQFAPQGTCHGELHSDVGCLLFFHGAVDPVVMAP